MVSSKILVFVGVPLGGKRSSMFRSSEDEMVNLNCPSKVKSIKSLGQVMECLVGKTQRDILGA